VIEFSLPLNISRAAIENQVGQFRRLSTTLACSPDGASLIEIEIEATEALVEWLHPFSWDAGLRGVTTPTRTLREGDLLCQHAGAYGTADAVAHRNGEPMRFPDQGDGHRYLARDAPGPDADHQDAAAWTLVGLGTNCLVLAWEYSGSVITDVAVRDGRVRITSTLPQDTFRPSVDSDLWDPDRSAGSRWCRVAWRRGRQLCGPW
jgi:hypothetical protein